MLGVSAVGAYQYFEASTTEQKVALPWFANPLVWITGFLLVGACAFKDGHGHVAKRNASSTAWVRVIPGCVDRY